MDQELRQLHEKMHLVRAQATEARLRSHQLRQHSARVISSGRGAFDKAIQKLERGSAAKGSGEASA